MCSRVSHEPTPRDEVDAGTQSRLLVEVEKVVQRFRVKRSWTARLRREFVHAVEEVSFSARRGETFGLVGESGCGKTTLGRMLVGLNQPLAGRITFDGQPVVWTDSACRKQFRTEIQMVFQDPYSALTPNLTVMDNIGEVARIHGGGTREEVAARVRELVDLVHLRGEIMTKYPHQLSGGQRQRVAIARALAVMPSFLILDEPFSALDVSTQAQIVNLLLELQQKLGLTYLLISHDLRLVQHMSDTIGVMYLGRLVEVLPAAAFHRCTHPYSRMLLAAVPNADPNSVSEDVPVRGELPSPIHPPSGCPFHPRCWLAEDRCRQDRPGLRTIGSEHLAACHLATSPSNT